MPSSRHAALMRTIQSLRNSPLRARRSRKAYWPECRTCSFAARRWRLREPEYPSARSRIARRCFLLWTARFTRAMERTPSSGRRRHGSRRRAVGCGRSGAAEQALDVLLVAAGHLGAALQAPRPLGGLVLEQVGAERLAPPDLAGARHLEPLRGSSVRLHLRHGS